MHLDEKLHIAFDAKRIYCNQTGLGNYSRNLVMGLGHLAKDFQLSLFTPTKKFNDFDQIADHYNMQVHTPQNKLSQVFHSAWRSLFLANVLGPVGPHIFHGLSNEIPFNIHYSPIKSIVTIHDLICIKKPELFSLIDRKVYTHKMRYACEKANHIIAISRETARDIKSHFGISDKKISVIYQHCHPAFYEQTSSSRRNKIKEKYELPSSFLLYVGTLEPRKNAISIVKAIHALKDKIDTPLILVGKGPKYRKKIEHLIQLHQLQDKVRLLGFVDEKDLPTLFQMATIFIYPSFYEGFGIPILEALASKTAVIASDIACFKECGGQAAEYFDPHDHHQLAQLILKLLSDSQKREAMAQQGSLHAENFKMEKIVAELSGLYREVLKEV